MLSLIRKTHGTRLYYGWFPGPPGPHSRIHLAVRRTIGCVKFLGVPKSSLSCPTGKVYIKIYHIHWNSISINHLWSTTLKDMGSWNRMLTINSEMFQTILRPSQSQDQFSMTSIHGMKASSIWYTLFTAPVENKTLGTSSKMDNNGIYSVPQIEELSSV